MSFYEVLGCEKGAPLQELKKNYQQLIKEYHPDKGQESDSEKFMKIDEAWKVLRDERSRKTYDASLLNDAYEGCQLIHAEIQARDLQFNENLIAKYQCRCGEYFEIEKDNLGEDECLYECNECSNCILIINK